MIDRLARRGELPLRQLSVLEPMRIEHCSSIFPGPFKEETFISHEASVRNHKYLEPQSASRYDRITLSSLLLWPLDPKIAQCLLRVRPTSISFKKAWVLGHMFWISFAGVLRITINMAVKHI